MNIWIWRTASGRRKRVLGMLRALAYVVALALVFGVIRIRSARAEWRTRTIELGRQMFELANATQHDVNKVVMNGQPIWIGSSLSTDSPRAVLDRYESHCTENSAQPVSDWRTLGERPPEARQAKSGKKPIVGLGTMRAGDDDEGTVICFTKSAHSKTSVREAIEAFGQTGDLGMLGSLRYAYVRKSAHDKTVVLTAWTDDTFKVSEMVPEEGKDAIGDELPDIPRPPNTRRLVATRVEGTPFGVNLYEGAEGPPEVVRFYEKEMMALGYNALDPEIERMNGSPSPPADPSRPALVRLFEKDGVVLTLVARATGDGKTATGLGVAGVSSVDDLAQRPARAKEQ